MTPAVHALIRRGDAARAERGWAMAAESYAAAVRRDPSLTHIWVQLGHMRKEAGEPHAAAFAYVEAARLDPLDPAPLGWLRSVAGHATDADRVVLAGMLRRSVKGGEEAFLLGGVSTGPGASGETVFDVSDLISYFARARLPTGIQRVQIETIVAAVTHEIADLRICCAAEGRDEWVELPRVLFLELAELATSGSELGDIAWTTAMTKVQIILMLRPPIVFGQEARLVNLGTSWWLQNYFLQVRNGQRESSLRYIPFVHDLIPVLAPQYCVGELIEDFISWIIGVFAHADGFLVNSQATRDDLIKVAAMVGYDLAVDRVIVVPLDADPRGRQPSTEGSVRPAVAALRSQRFVLFVSTIESRKGHLVALDAWRRLLDQEQDPPLLVCVGNNGWLNQEFYARLAADPLLRDRVVLLSGLWDHELAALYRSCLFTIYPSFYEGWGLPITEALSFGKVVIAADNSSLREAGGSAALYFPTGSAAALSEAVGRFARDPAALAAQEQVVASAFRPRRWQVVAEAIIGGARALTEARSLPVRRPTAMEVDTWYSLARTRHRLLKRGYVSAEMLRTGHGWRAPDALGSMIRGDKATLRFARRKVAGDQDLLIRLQARRTTKWTLAIDGRIVDEGTADPGVVGCARGRLPHGDGDVTIDLTARAAQDQGDPEFSVLSLCHTSSSPGASFDLANSKGNADDGRVGDGISNAGTGNTQSLSTRHSLC